MSNMKELVDRGLREAQYLRRILIDNGVRPEVAADLAGTVVAFELGLRERGLQLSAAVEYRLLVEVIAAAGRAGYVEIRPGDPAPLGGPGEGVDALGRPGSPRSGGS